MPLVAQSLETIKVAHRPITWPSLLALGQMVMPFNNTSIDDSLNFQTERIRPTVTERCVPPRLNRTGTICGTWTSQYGSNGQMTMTLHNYGCRPLYRSSMASIRTAVREICVPAKRQFHMDLIDKRQWRCRTAGLDDSLGILTEICLVVSEKYVSSHVQTHMCQMGKRSQHCTNIGLDNSLKLRMENYVQHFQWCAI